jgi:hypothetical protein
MLSVSERLQQASTGTTCPGRSASRISKHAMSNERGSCQSVRISSDIRVDPRSSPRVRGLHRVQLGPSLVGGDNRQSGAEAVSGRQKPGASINAVLPAGWKVGPRRGGVRPLLRRFPCSCRRRSPPPGPLRRDGASATARASYRTPRRSLDGA